MTLLKFLMSSPGILVALLIAIVISYWWEGLSPITFMIVFQTPMWAIFMFVDRVQSSLLTISLYIVAFVCLGGSIYFGVKGIEKHHKS